MTPPHPSTGDTRDESPTVHPPNGHPVIPRTVDNLSRYPLVNLLFLNPFAGTAARGGGTGGLLFSGVTMSTTVTRASLMFEADLDITPFNHGGVTICRLHVTASASAEPGFWWAEGVGNDVHGRPTPVYALTSADLPRPVLDAINRAYREARQHIPERLTDDA